jgi:membrane protein YqaA with SNARE-associated domain
MTPVEPTLDPAALVEQATLRTRTRLTGAVFLGETLLVVGLLVWWLIWGRHDPGHGPLVLFLYCFPSEFLIAPVPHEPVLIYFGRILSPLTVALYSVAGTVLVEALNYHATSFVTDTQPMRRLARARWLRRMVTLFERWPFATLVLGGLAPLPFYPFRFLVTLTRYPISRYLLAIFVSRLPRFYLIALFGALLPISDRTLAVTFVVMIVAFSLPFLVWRGRGRTTGQDVPSAGDTPVDARPSGA